MLSFIYIQTVFAGEVVRPQSIYESEHFSKTVNETINALQERYPDLINVFEIGKSVQGEAILAAELGKGPKQVLINGTHHARECLTTVLILDQINYIAKLCEENNSAAGSNVKALLDKVTIVFVPLLNPDGANLVLNGQNKAWKSNINGVDLNRNYPTKYPEKITSWAPSFKDYPRPKPFSEPETQALKELCEERLFDGAIAYHSSGEIIYWHFNQKDISRDYEITRAISAATGYKLVGRGNPTTGNGFTDWFIETYQKPGLTIEISPYVWEQKVPFYRYQSIWQKNKNVAIIFSSKVNEHVTLPEPTMDEIDEYQAPIS